MANKAHLAILRKGVDAWNEWRKKNPGIQPDLRKAKISGGDPLQGGPHLMKNFFAANLKRVLNF